MSEATPASRETEAVITPRVLVFFDYACQFCYLDWPRFKRLRAEHDVELFLAPFELRPALPLEGVSVAEIGGGHSPHVEEHMMRMAQEAGIGLVFPPRVPNTHKALVLGEYARDLGPEVHEVVHEAIFSAYNERAEDIGDEAVLIRIAEEHALDPDDVKAVFADGGYDDRLHQFYHFALSLGVSATPSALICNELFIGTRPYQVLADSLQRCLVGEQNIDEIIEAEGEDAAYSSRSERDDGSPATIDR